MNQRLPHQVLEYLPVKAGDYLVGIPLSAIMFVRRMEEQKGTPSAGHAPNGRDPSEPSSIPVAVLSEMFSATRAQDDVQNIVVISDQSRAGILLVDRVFPLEKTPADRQQPVSRLVSGKHRMFSAIVVTEEQEPILIMDSFRLLDWLHASIRTEAVPS